MSELLARDQSLFLLINKSWTSSFLDSTLPVLTDLHKNLWFQIVAVPIIMVLLFWKERYRAFRILLMLTVVVGLSDSFNYRILKKSFDRGRPESVGMEPILRSHSHSGPSFPSNHASNMFALGVIMTLLYRRWGFLVLFLAAAVAYSRVYVGVHFPLDVIGGGLEGASFGFIGFRAFTYYESGRPKLKQPPTSDLDRIST